ncbi:MAG: alpha/beta fold hydrolase [Actinobacteria bacterium]|nr:alpha/beta fold hydrolase [Actinomycetota bacterium]
MLADIEGARLWYEERGEGPAVVLLHAGIADARMWDEQVDALAEGHRVIRYDMRGYGHSPLPPGPFSHVRDLEALLAHLDCGHVSLVGLSHGGQVALDFALTRPEPVKALVLVAPSLADHEWSPEARRVSDEEDACYEAGDLDGAVEVNLRAWVDGPLRASDAVEPAVRERVRVMCRRSFELYSEAMAQGEPGPSAPLDPPAGARLGEVRAPTLVLVGDADMPDMLTISERLESGIAGARRVVLPGVAHMVNLERPERFTELVLAFLP